MNDRPYFESWLRRTRKQLMASGRLSQVAMVLAAENGGAPDDWRNKLRSLLEEEETPTLEFLTRIDRILSGPPPSDQDDSPIQKNLF